MLRKEDNELLTRVTEEAPMAKLGRNYWVPACRIEALKPGGDPRRVRLFGNNYVAFRAEDSRVGFFDEYCPHRGCSLLLARNEDCGLTCIFHGWKFDVSGSVVDVPTEPNRYEFGKKIKVRDFPTREAGSVVWVYVGEGTPPPFPEFEFNSLGSDQMDSFVNYTTCNWLQGLEGVLDSAHVGILHQSNIKISAGETFEREDLSVGKTVDNNAPYYVIDRKDHGMTTYAIRDTQDGKKYVRKYEYVFPFFSFIPNPKYNLQIMICAIPMDDEHTAQWYFLYHPWEKFKFDDYKGYFGSYDQNDFYQPPGTFENNWYQVRDELKNHWTGMVNVPIQFEDFVVQESMGPIVDRSKEQLGTSDTFIIQVRRLLLDSVRRYAEGGTPFGLDKKIDYKNLRSGAYEIISDQDIRQEESSSV